MLPNREFRDFGAEDFSVLGMGFCMGLRVVWLSLGSFE